MSVSVKAGRLGAAIRLFHDDVPASAGLRPLSGVRSMRHDGCELCGPHPEQPQNGFLAYSSIAHVGYMLLV